MVLGIQHLKGKSIRSRDIIKKNCTYGHNRKNPCILSPILHSIRTYCHSRHNTNVAVAEETFDCPLVELNLIAELPNGDGYEFQRGIKETLPDEVFIATLVAFWDASFSERDAMPFRDLMYAPLSPGRIFRLDEDTMTLYLERLEDLTDGALRYDETADLKQVYRSGNLNPMELLERYYA